MLVWARLCCDLDCGEVFDGRTARTCPRCGFALSMPLSKFLNRPAKKESAAREGTI